MLTLGQAFAELARLTASGPTTTEKLKAFTIEKGADLFTPPKK